MPEKNSPDTPPEDQEQPFISHLLELRTRLLRIILSVLVVFLALFHFRDNIYTFMAGPLLRQLPQGSHMVAIEVTSPFLIPIKLTLVAALVVAIPYILYQIWAFVAPGLYRHERQLVLPLLVASTALFYAGVLFAYFLVLPVAFAFLTSTTPQGVEMMTDIGKYLNFVLTVFIAFGVAFQVPIATILLVWAGVVTPESLAAKRPYMIVAAFVIGALLTPPDVFSQTLLAVPMWLLYEAGVFFSRIFVRKKREAEAQAAAAAAGTTAGVPAVSDAPNAGEEEHAAPAQEDLDAELDKAEAEEKTLLQHQDEDDGTDSQTPK